MTPLAEIAPKLRCPRCRGKLNFTSPATFACTSNSCDLARKPFPVSQGLPALVDFPNSVLSENDLSRETGVIERRTEGRAGAFLKRHCLPYNSRGADNALRFLSCVREMSDSPLILIVGGGEVGEGADALYDAPDIKLVAFDIYASPNIQLIADAHAMPFLDAMFDGVWIQAVLEHVLEPETVVQELTRILKPGGIVYAETPFMQSVHEGAYDFTRFTDSGHRWLFRQFELLDSGVVLGPFAGLLWSIRQAVSALLRSRTAGIMAELAFFWLKYLDRLVPDPLARDGASGLFFMGKKATKTLTPADIVAYYRGGQRGPSQ